jgi:hypothetical protein
VLFTGSIRENLAPFGGHCDAALWSALRRAHLAPVVEEWAREGLGGLDYQLGEGGSPLSAGQKQLLALARALLNPAKVCAGAQRLYACYARALLFGWAAQHACLPHTAEQHGLRVALSTQCCSIELPGEGQWLKWLNLQVKRSCQCWHAAWYCWPRFACMCSLHLCCG